MFCITVDSHWHPRQDWCQAKCSKYEWRSVMPDDINSSFPCMRYKKEAYLFQISQIWIMFYAKNDSIIFCTETDGVRFNKKKDPHWHFRGNWLRVDCSKHRVTCSIAWWNELFIVMNDLQNQAHVFSHSISNQYFMQDWFNHFLYKN